MDTLLSRELAINSPRYRRRSSIHFDAVHDVGEHRDNMAPAQLYSTLSGRLFHAGRIVIVLVGPPARGKTHISVSLARYLGWLGVKTRVYHLGDYRRATLGKGLVPDDYFHKNPSPSTQLLRQRILKQCRNDIFRFLNDEKGQVAIYDAVNPIAEERAALAKEFQRDEVKTLFLESYVEDQAILEENVSNVKLSSPDFANMDRAAATALYLERLDKSLPNFETLTNSEDLAWIKVIDAGKRIETNDKDFTFIHKRIILYLMNLHNKSKRIFFAIAGRSSVDRDIFLSDSSLSPDGVEYAQALTKTLLAHRKEEHAEHIKLTGHDEPMKPLDVWTSQRKRAMETAQFLEEAGCKVDSKSQLVQLNPGVLEKLSAAELDKEYPDERRKHAADPYHHRWPRGESYHDLAVRLEPVIFELERKQTDVLIIAHESVLRVIYGYMMACAAMDIPVLQFPRNEIVEIVPGSYTNEAARIVIPGIPEEALSLASPGVLNLPLCTTPSGSNTPSMRVTSPGAMSPLRQLDPSVHPKPSMLSQQLLNVPDDYQPPLSVDDALVGSEEYFPPIAEEQEPEEDEEKKQKREKKEGEDKAEEVAKRRDSQDMTTDIEKALAGTSMA